MLSGSRSEVERMIARPRVSSRPIRQTARVPWRGWLQKVAWNTGTRNSVLWSTPYFFISSAV